MSNSSFENKQATELQDNCGLEQAENAQNEAENPGSDENAFIETTLESVVEAALFACDEPITAAKLANIAEVNSPKDIDEAVEKLNSAYQERNSAFKIEKIAGGYQMLTHSVYNAWLKKLISEKKESKLSQAALETLSVIAYKQPVIRADVESIRGVSSGEIIRGLMNKGLVKMAGRAEILGRPVLYGTTKKFLELFGLDSIKDLPDIGEFKK
ncbi:SMC-Scp complex subunit ScpB [Sedimentisphaera salicampi]|uniref:SMC-Scp complex subunit ScpB n=1 Tax=Sedimentisphaera salicampi TaxID=1941349 RepID=UPI000B9D2394|nr:SMC-Scp complex subunit ScpB [Sedimentisphaera salicampi]OXU16026.1 SMC-Scp complex subunit ScpB [Sedimentisphaera salicampi]